MTKLDEATREELIQVIMEYENCLTWDTTCKNCAALMDRNYEQYCEIQELKRELKQSLDETKYW